MKIKNVLAKIIKTAILAICLGTISLGAPYAHRKYIRNIAEQSVVQIYGVEGSGTGFHIKLTNGKVVILTNKHICQMTGPLMVRAFPGDIRIARKIISISTDHDLCVIEALDGYKAITIGSNPKLGDELYTLGHPRGEALNVSKGEYFDDKEIQMGEEVSKDGTCAEGKLTTQETFFGPVSFCVINRNTIELSSPTYPGNSGSAVVNKFGNLVGVIFAGNSQIENMGFAVPLSYVKDFLSTIK